MLFKKNLICSCLLLAMIFTCGAGAPASAASPVHPQSLSDTGSTIKQSPINVHTNKELILILLSIVSIQLLAGLYLLIKTVRRHRAEKQLQITQAETLHEREELLQLFVENTPAAVAMCDRQMAYLAYSRRWITDYHLQDKNLIGQCHYDVFPELPQGWKEDHQRCFAGEILKYRAEKFPRADGTLDWVRRELYPWYNSTGEIGGLIMFTEVITKQIRSEEEKKQLEAQLRLARKMEALGTLAGGIAHDFNNILTPILIESEMALLKSDPAESFTAHMEKIHAAGERARNLVKQILSFSRQGELEKKPFAVHLIVKEALKLLKASMPATIEIRQYIQSDAGMILGDPTQFHQVMLNLCTNAGHAMREAGGILTIELRPFKQESRSAASSTALAPGDYLELTVSDTGIGMSPQVLERIFEPYYTTKGKGGGTGLGLSVAHGIIASHAGVIQVASEPGQGTTFRIYLPRIDSNAEAVVAKQPVPRGGNEKVLLVDDEVDTVESVGEMLDFLGYRVTRTENSTRALELFRADPDDFDLVIADQTMPKMTGTQLSEAMLSLKPNIPIILCTGYNDSISEEKVLAIGIRVFMMKPFGINEIHNAISKALENGRANVGESK